MSSKMYFCLRRTQFGQHCRKIFAESSHNFSKFWTFPKKILTWLLWTRKNEFCEYNFLSDIELTVLKTGLLAPGLKIKKKKSQLQGC